MRLNKKLIKGLGVGMISIRKDERGDYVDMRELPGAWAIMTVLLLCLWGVFAAFTWVIPSQAELQRYDKICDLIAGKDPHYTSRNYIWPKDNSNHNPMACDDIKTGKQVAL